MARILASNFTVLSFKSGGALERANYFGSEGAILVCFRTQLSMSCFAREFRVAHGKPSFWEAVT
jgi:hypothetical protein